MIVNKIIRLNEMYLSMDQVLAVWFNYIEDEKGDEVEMVVNLADFQEVHVEFTEENILELSEWFHLGGKYDQFRADCEAYKSRLANSRQTKKVVTTSGAKKAKPSTN